MSLLIGAPRLSRDLREYEAQHPDDEARTVASRFLGTLSQAERDSALIDLLEDEVGWLRRDRVREIEQTALKRQADEQRAAEGRRAQEEWNRSKAEREAMWRARPSEAPRNTRVFKDWATTEEGRAYLGREAKREAEQAERERLYREDPPEYSRRFGFQAAINAFKQEVRLELTAELLGASFALGDGRTVTWGEATLEDHRVRAEHLLQNVQGNLETIQVHEAAAALIRRTRVACLNEVAA